MTIRASNITTRRFRGFLRCTVNEPLPHPWMKMPTGETLAMGRAIGIGAHVVDVFVDLQPGQEIELDPGLAVPCEPLAVTLPTDLWGHFGALHVNDVPMQVLAAEVDGAAVTATLRALAEWDRVAVDVKVTYYPSTDSIVRFEVIATAIGSQTRVTLSRDLVLRWGDSLAVIYGAQPDGVVMRAGDSLANAQWRCVSGCFVWPRHFSNHDEVESAMAIAENGVAAVGLDRVHIDGPTIMPGQFSARQWSKHHFQAAWQGMHTWTRGQLGPSPNTGVTGEVEAQHYHCGGEALRPGGAHAAGIRIASALKAHAHPMHHREPDGQPLNIDAHPRLVMYAGRPKERRDDSPDQLGQPRPLILPAEANGFSGPDGEHLIVGDLAAAAMLGSWAAQVGMRDHAVLYLFTSLDRPGHPNTAVDAARQWLYEAALVVHLHHVLDDRALAKRVVDRFRSRINTYFVPEMRGRTYWRVYTNDRRVHPTGQGVKFWGEAGAAWEIWRAADILGGMDEAKELAYRLGLRVLDVAWRRDPSGNWYAQPEGDLDGNPTAPNPQTYSWTHFGMPLAVAVVLAVDKDNAKARAIAEYLMSTVQSGGTFGKVHAWLPPTFEKLLRAGDPATSAASDITEDDAS